MTLFCQAHFDREPLPPARHTFDLLTEGWVSTLAGRIVCRIALAKRAVGLEKPGCKNYYSIQHKSVALACQLVK